MKKYEPRKVFILDNGEYRELTYEEFERHKENEPAYGDKLFIPVQGCLMETDRTHYNDFYREKERQKYLRFLDRKHGLLSIDAFDSDDDNGTDFLQTDVEDVSETVAHSQLLDKLRKAVDTLPEDEKALITQHFYDEVPQTELARKYGINQSNISRKIGKILSKIKKLMEI
mgnify:FL=1